MDGCMRIYHEYAKTGAGVEEKIGRKASEDEGKD